MLTKEALQALREKSVELKSVQSKGADAHNVTVVHHKNGHRLTITPALYEELGSPETLQFSMVSEDGILLIGSNLGMKHSYKVSTTDKPTIYKASLTEQIATSFDLDYSAKSSITFYDVQVEGAEDGVTIAVVNIRANGEENDGDN